MSETKVVGCPPDLASEPGPAGIPRAEHFGMHPVRKTTATKLYAFNTKVA